LVLFTDDVHAELDALVAEEHRRARDKLADLMLALAAERAVEGALGFATGGHGHLLVLLATGRVAIRDAPAVPGLIPAGYGPRGFERMTTTDRNAHPKPLRASYDHIHHQDKA